jgi:hypothetical protein
MCNKVPHIINVFIYLFMNNLQYILGTYCTGVEFRNYGVAMKLVFLTLSYSSEGPPALAIFKP